MENNNSETQESLIRLSEAVLALAWIHLAGRSDQARIGPRDPAFVGFEAVAYESAPCPSAVDLTETWALPASVMTDVVIRSAERADLDQILLLEEASFAADRLSRRTLARWLASGDRVFLLACEAGRLVAALLLLHRPGHRLGRLYSLAVASDRRGAGLGGRLLSAGEAAAAERGCIDLRLEVAVGNQAAIALYQSRGYQTFGSYEAYYHDGGDALRMQKRLANQRERAHLWTVPFCAAPDRRQTAGACLRMAHATLLSTEDTGSPAFFADNELVLSQSNNAGWHSIVPGMQGAEDEEIPALFRTIGKAADKVPDTATRHYWFDQTPDAKADHWVRMGGLELRCFSGDGTPVPQGTDWIDAALAGGALVCLLIPLWCLARRLTPRWCLVVGGDSWRLFVHDPLAEQSTQQQYQPVARVEVADQVRAAFIARVPVALTEQSPGKTVAQNSDPS